MYLHALFRSIAKWQIAALLKKQPNDRPFVTKSEQKTVLSTSRTMSPLQTRRLLPTKLLFKLRRKRINDGRHRTKMPMPLVSIDEILFTGKYDYVCIFIYRFGLLAISKLLSKGRNRDVAKRTCKIATRSGSTRILARRSTKSSTATSTIYRQRNGKSTT